MRSTVLTLATRGHPDTAASITPARRSDRNAVAALLHRTARPGDPMVPAALGALPGVYSEASCATLTDIVLLARQGERIVGVAAGVLTSTRCAEIAVWVLVHHRGHGVGARLVDALTGQLSARGYEAALAAVPTADDAAMALATRLARRYTGVLQMDPDGVTTLVLPQLHHATGQPEVTA